jgi:hypothetical protein
MRIDPDHAKLAFKISSGVMVEESLHKTKQGTAKKTLFSSARIMVICIHIRRRIPIWGITNCDAESCTAL